MMCSGVHGREIRQFWQSHDEIAVSDGSLAIGITSGHSNEFSTWKARSSPSLTNHPHVADAGHNGLVLSGSAKANVNSTSGSKER